MCAFAHPREWAQKKSSTGNAHVFITCKVQLIFARPNKNRRRHIYSGIHKYVHTHTHTHTCRYHIVFRSTMFVFTFPIYIVACLAYCAICSLARSCSCSSDRSTYTHCARCLHCGCGGGVATWHMLRRRVLPTTQRRCRGRAVSSFATGLIHEPNLISIRHSEFCGGGGGVACSSITKKP